MDPQVVLEWIELVRTFVAEYGGILFGYARKTIELLVYAVMHLPGWIVAAWAYLLTLLEAIKAFYG